MKPTERYQGTQFVTKEWLIKLNKVHERNIMNLKSSANQKKKSEHVSIRFSYSIFFRSKLKLKKKKTERREECAIKNREGKKYNESEVFCKPKKNLKKRSSLLFFWVSWTKQLWEWWEDWKQRSREILQGDCSTERGLTKRIQGERLFNTTRRVHREIIHWLPGSVYIYRGSRIKKPISKGSLKLQIVFLY